MLKNSLATSFRGIKRDFFFSLINILGLSVGLALVIILSEWLRFEYSFDKFHYNRDKIFRVVVEFQQENLTDNFANTPAPLGGTLKNYIPEILDFVRFGSLGRTLVKFEDHQYWENIDLADPSIFNIFSFKLLYGNTAQVLKEPHSIVISETKARKYFGNKNPVGQTLLIGDSGNPYKITGVMKDIPVNSQLRFDFLGSFSELQNNISWGHWNYSTYILAKDKGSYKIISQKLSEIVKKLPYDGKSQLYIQPLTRIHLHSNLRSDLETNKNLQSVYIISSILILVLILACINYMNLVTARYSRKAKEIGLRKVAGASNSNLLIQFLCESFAMTFISFLVGIFICFLLIPVFRSITDIPLSINEVLSLSYILKYLLIIVLVAFIIGSYPALMFSSVNPVSALHDDFVLARIITLKGLRKGLVIFQFVISIILIAGTLVIRAQMSFIKSRDLGLTPDQIIVVPIYQVDVKPKYELFKKEIQSSPKIVNASAVNYFLGSQGCYQNTWWEGLPEGDNSNGMDWIPVDQDFINTLDIKLQKGEPFRKDYSDKSQVEYILNELAVKQIGWTDPIGKKFNIVGKGEVVGVVKDFNFKSLHQEITPLALVFYPDLFDNLLIKISTKDIPTTLDFLKSKWENLFPQYPFEYSFLSEDFQRMYIKDLTVSRIIFYVSIIALFIACLGLFGLVQFTIERKTKEIGIRKVAGSTTGRIFMMTNLEYMKWILISFFLSFPVIIYFMQKWLENFAYRIRLSWWIFALAVLLPLIIAFLTVSWQSWKAAVKNPADALRYE